MKATYYGIWFEYYKDGSRKSGIVTREAQKKPKTRQRTTPIAACFEYWFTTEAIAIEVKGNIEKTVGCLSDMFNFYRGFVEAGNDKPTKTSTGGTL